MVLVRAVLCLVAVTLGAAACAQSATTATPSTTATVPTTTAAHDQGTTPSGWIPIAFDNAQISVPADWVTSTADCPFGSVPGMVIVRAVASVTGCVLEIGSAIANVVSITPGSPPAPAPQREAHLNQQDHRLLGISDEQRDRIPGPFPWSANRRARCAGTRGPCHPDALRISVGDCQQSFSWFLLAVRGHL